MKSRYLLIAFLFAGISLHAQTKTYEPDTIPHPEVSVTEHSAKIGAGTVDYTARAGTFVVTDNENKPWALMGFTSYTKGHNRDSKTTTSTSAGASIIDGTRPIVFAYNGGPGSASYPLHMGILGPRRVVVADTAFTANSPYEIVDNQYSILDVADLVMIDPMGTGLSLPMGKHEFKEFWGVDGDIQSLSAFIKQFLIQNGRLNSPKYLLGESYGTFRNAGVMNNLQEDGIAMNGVVMVSAVFNLTSLIFPNDYDLSYLVHFPTYAATAWYHNKLKTKPENFEAFLDEVRIFTRDEYSVALMKGDQLTKSEKDNMAQKLSDYSGLSKEYWLKADLRVKAGEYFAELLRDEGETVGRLDSRFTGINPDLLSQESYDDPFMASIVPPLSTAFLNYFYQELGVRKTLNYKPSASVIKGWTWNWDHDGNTSWGTRSSITTSHDLASALNHNPKTKMLIFNGYFDLGTPFYGVEYTIDHLDLRPEIKANISMKYFEAGHMMYVEKNSMKQFKDDLVAFINSTHN